MHDNMLLFLLHLLIRLCPCVYQLVSSALLWGIIRHNALFPLFHCSIGICSSSRKVQLQLEIFGYLLTTHSGTTVTVVQTNTECTESSSSISGTLSSSTLETLSSSAIKTPSSNLLELTLIDGSYEASGYSYDESLDDAPDELSDYAFEELLDYTLDAQTISTLITVPSSQQENQPTTLPEFTTTQTRTRIATYYTWYPIIESWSTKRSEPSIYIVDLWHNVTVTSTAMDTITHTMTATTTAITTATTITCTNSGVPKSDYQPNQVFHHGCYGTIRLRGDRIGFSISGCSSLSPSMSVSPIPPETMRHAIVTLEHSIAPCSLTQSSKCSYPTAIAQLPEGQLRPTKMPQSSQSWSREQIWPVNSIVSAGSSVIRSLPTKAELIIPQSTFSPDIIQLKIK